MRNDFRIAGHVEDCAGELELLAQFRSVGQRAVMRHCHQPFDVVDDDRLRVLAGIDAGGAIANVGDCEIALTERAEVFGGEYVVDQPRVLMAAHDALLIDCDARAFLTAMLQRE